MVIIIKKNLKDDVTLKTGNNVAENSVMLHRNKWPFKYIQIENSYFV